jgi:enoyl-CoA hydratase/carnithine racemase
MTEVSDAPHVRVERRGGVDLITLDRPEARNALTHRAYRELEVAVRTSSARCIAVTGSDPAFCSGDAVRQVMGGGDKAPVLDAGTGPRFTPAAGALLSTDIPVIAAVNGAAVGWGMEPAMMADVRQRPGQVRRTVRAAWVGF